MGHALLIDVRHHEQDIGILEGRFDKLHHAFLKLVSGVEHAWGVAVDNLVVVFVDDAHDAVARGLGLGIDDAQTFTHKAIHQRAFADVGRPHDVDESRPVVGRRFRAGLVVESVNGIGSWRSKVRFGKGKARRGFAHDNKCCTFDVR